VLPLAAGINEGGHYFRYFGPSEVRATSGQHLCGHYFGPSEVRATSGQHLGGHYFR
jgi:hypothetical protein